MGRTVVTLFSLGDNERLLFFAFLVKKRKITTLVPLSFSVLLKKGRIEDMIR